MRRTYQCRASFLVHYWRLIALLLCAPVVLATQDSPPKKDDPWNSVRFLAGKWDGVAEGEAGRGTVKRTYAFVMNGRFLHERNMSTYPPQEKNPRGEVHEHWTMFSYDRARNSLVMRQFHVEGFVNQYAMLATVGTDASLLFESEGFENLPAGWKAREKYAVISESEFVETFELAPPGKNFEVYSQTRFKRAK
jgi:hypothetical protein